MRRRRGVRWLAIAAAMVAAAVSPVGTGRAPSASATVGSSLAATAAPATGVVTAHDDRFWLGDQPITFEGTNLHALCCASSEFAQLRAWGMNFIRNQMQWSRLEPNPPVQNGDGTWTHTYDQAYLNIYASTVSRAASAGLYVLVGNHGCACTLFGYPDWVYLSPYNSHGLTYPRTDVGASLAATDFWSDPLRQQFMIDALTAVVSKVSAIDGVAGYEMLNEPQAGTLPNTAETTATILDWQLRAARAVRSIDPPRTVFFTTRYGYAPGLPAADLSGFTALGNVAFDVHDYFGGRWGTGLIEDPESSAFEQTYQPMYNHTLSDDPPPEYPYIGTTLGQVRFMQNVLDSLQPWHIPLLVGEFGIYGADTPSPYLYFGTVTAALDHLGLSWAMSEYDSPIGFEDEQGNLEPWAQIVIDAANQ
ncbi:MAG TPA: cellulase family glycosylhydrolase [Actinomycetota bacterium]|nr:cellulase family glycosylhydrolase [Actinomycetota bacterium]